MIKPTKGNYTRGFSFFHKAVDIDNVMGTPIVAPEVGQVTFVGRLGSGVNNAGLVVQIGNTAKNAHRLCHLSKTHVKVGDRVKAGQTVGKMGNSGFVIRGPGGDGSHLHWIYWRNGKRVDGRRYITSLAPPKPKPKPKKFITAGFGDTVDLISRQYNLKIDPKQKNLKKRYIGFSRLNPLVADLNKIKAGKRYRVK